MASRTLPLAAEPAPEVSADTKQKQNEYEYQYRKDYEDDWHIHRLYIETFDSYEAMLIGQVYDSVSNSIEGSKITDSYSATLAIERASRVMGKLPDGVTESMPKADQGKAAFMDILRQKWIYPNANAQHSFETKLRLWQLYSDVYGYMPMFYDWNVSPEGYVGPDCWIWNPRNLIPQQGRTSKRDMEYMTALTWVGKNYLDARIEEMEDQSGQGEPDEDSDPDDDAVEAADKGGGWDLEALKMLRELVVNETARADLHQDTLVSRSRVPQSVKKGICLATRYEAGEDGEWVTFAPDHGYIEVRRLKNPHNNGLIPFVIKYSQPLYDSFYGLGDFQRAKPLQFARDGLTNFYFKGIKMNLIPPLIANANGVLKHTLDYREGAVMMETIPNSIRRLETSTAGLATYQEAQTSLTGSLLSLFGSTNADLSASQATNPSQGRTPAAISLYGDKEASRDGQSRAYLEEAIQELTNGFFSLVANIGTEDIPVNLFADDIEDIRESGLTDVLGLLQGKFQADRTLTSGTLKINPKIFKDLVFRFKINWGSTAKMDKDAQRQALEEFIGIIGKLQNVIQSDPTTKVDWPSIMKTYEKLTDIEGVHKFITTQAAPTLPPAQPSPTAITMPNGQVHETADLVKLFVAVEDMGVKNAILQAMNLPQIQPQPTVIPSGHAFNNPILAAQAAAIHASGPVGQPQTPPEAPAEPEPQVTPQGRVFKDPTIAKAAAALEKA